ncbi:MAG: superoxide dismutase family protein [Polyangiaceae bacterium]
MKFFSTHASLALLLALAAACQRRSDPAQINPTRESPIVPDVSPAKPDSNPNPTAVAPPLEPSPESVGAPSTAMPSATDAPREATAKFKAAPSTKLSGKAHLNETSSGVVLTIDLQNGPPGKKGIHVHEKPDCSDIPNKSMGEHFAPDVKTHGLPEGGPHHLGDLGNIEIGKNGNAHLEFLALHANLKDSDPLSFIGRAIVIHEGDDKGTQPSGGSGKPIACAVIEKN